MEPHYYNVDVNWNTERKGVMCSPELNRDAGSCIEVATPPEFPKGIHVTMYDNKGKKTIIVADYGVTFKGTDIIDLQHNVKISNETGQMLETEQLYFDQKNEWFFTEKKFKFTDPKGVSFGQGIDFSKDFKIVNSQRINGQIDSQE